MVPKKLLSLLKYDDIDAIKQSVSMACMPNDVRNIFMEDMSKNNSSEYIMLNTVLNLSLRIDKQDQHSISLQLNNKTKIALDNHIIDKTKEYVAENYPDFPEYLV